MSVAGCPLVLERTEGERSLCEDVRCTDCGLLRDLLVEVGDVEQVCSGCLEERDRPLGFQLAGDCDRCGRSRYFLMPVT